MSLSHFVTRITGFFIRNSLLWLRLGPFLLLYECEPPLEFKSQVGIFSGEAYRLARLLPHPGIQIILSGGDIPALAMNGHSFRGPSLHNGGGVSQKPGDLLPAPEHLRIAFRWVLRFRMLRHDKEMHSHSAELGRKATSLLACLQSRGLRSFLLGPELCPACPLC